MAHVDAELSRELARIVASPYPPSLTKLARLLTQAHVMAVRSYIRNQLPCAITKLATLVNEALPLWHNTVDILRVLSHSPEFAEKLLLQDPALLDALLTRANSSRQGFDQYQELCVTLLSRPLPDAIALPSSAQPFFLRVFELAARAPHVEALKPVYCMLNGACKGFFGLLSAQARHSFDLELCKILSSSGAGQNTMLMLWCIGIVILAEHPEVVGRLHDPRPSADSLASLDARPLEWKSAAGRKVFSPDGCQKTVNLTYLSVIWATKGDVGISDAEALEGIRIATRTIQCVDRQVREAWPTSSDLARKTFPKLPAKIQRKGINPAIQLEALGFYAMVAGRDHVPAHLVTEYGNALCSAVSMVDASDLEECLSTSLPLFAPSLQEFSVCAILSMVLRSTSSSATAPEMTSMKALVDELAAVIPHCQELRSNIISALSSSDLQDILEQFLRAKVGYIQEDRAHSCQPYNITTHSALISATTSMLLTSAFASNSALPSSIGIPLLNKQRLLIPTATECLHQTSTYSQRPVSLFQQECTPLSGEHLQDWRARLKAELENQGFYQRDSVLRSVAQICHDLEIRCETAEEPLRREKERSSRLEAELSDMRKKVTQLEEKAFDHGLIADGLLEERDQLQTDKDEISAHLEQLKIDLDDANAKAHETLITTRETYKATEVQLRSIILAHEEDIHARETEVEQLREVNENLSGQLEEGRQESKNLSDRYARLQTELEEKEEEIQIERRKLRDQVEDISRLHDEGCDLDRQLQSCKSELANTTSRLDDLQKCYRELGQTSTEALQKLEAQYAKDMSVAACKATEEYKQLQDQLQHVVRDARKINERHEEGRRELQELQSTVPPLKLKIEALTEECIEKDSELDELRALKNRVLASLGPLPDTGHAQRKARPTTDSGDARTIRQHRRRKSAFYVQETVPNDAVGTQGINSTAVESIANTSFTSSDSQPSPCGSTPKRLKPHSSFKVPAMHTPYSNKPELISKSISKKSSPTKRSALRPVSPNRRHTSVGFTLSGKEEDHAHKQNLPVRGRRGSLQDESRVGLDSSSFFAGTPFTPGNFMSGTGRAPQGDETVTEL